MTREEYVKRYEDMMYLYRMLSLEAQNAPSVFYGMHDRVIGNDPFNAYHHNDVTSGIHFRVHKNHNCVGGISISHDGKTMTINSEYLHKMRTDDAHKAFYLVNDCIKQLRSLGDRRREWGNVKYVYDEME